MTLSEAKIIAIHLGTRLLNLLGAENLTFRKDENCFTFKIKENENGVNYIRIELTETNLYDIKYLGENDGKTVVITQSINLYTEQLQDDLQGNTGLYLQN